jgi:hypothetical protein
VDLITADTMQSLLEPGAAPRVSIYLPTHRAGVDMAQDPIRLRKLLGEARSELVVAGTRGPEADALLEAARRLEHASTFWEGQGDGLALFVEPGRTRDFRLPGPVDELVVVADAYHVKPLWPLLAGSGAFHILALSRHRVRLLWADRYSVEPVDLPDDVPSDVEEAMRFADPEPQLQHRAVGRAGGGRVVAAFHGHGSGAERFGQVRTEAFLRAVDQGVRSLVDPTTPVLLAGVDELVATYRNLSRLHRLLDAHVSGNTDELSDGELHQRALAITEPISRQRMAADVASFGAAGNRAAVDMEPVVVAAMTGRIATLFLPARVQVWGTFDDGRVSIHDERQPGDRDLLDLAGSAVWRLGGRLHVLEPDELPGPGPVAAILRY